MISALIALMLSNAAVAAATDVPSDELPIACDDCDAWNADQAPFQIYKDVYYVGVHGLSSVLIKTKGGLILLDGDLPQSVPEIVAHIRALGFNEHDVRWILSSHAHFDHAGGIAALQRITGANVGASALAAATLRVGTLPVDDPQYDAGKSTRFPPVPHVEAVLDGDSIGVGGTRLTAHYTAGHSPGGTTWTWRSCEKYHCYDLVYADSLSPSAAGAFRFGDASKRPDTADVLRRSIIVMSELPCDVMISVHPDASGVLGKAAANARDPSRNAFVDRNACRDYANQAQSELDARLKVESAGKAH